MCIRDRNSSISARPLYNNIRCRRFHQHACLLHTCLLYTSTDYVEQAGYKQEDMQDAIDFVVNFVHGKFIIHKMCIRDRFKLLEQHICPEAGSKRKQEEQREEPPYQNEYPFTCLLYTS